MLVEAKIGEDNYSIILQNAETVRLVCPAQSTNSGTDSSCAEHQGQSVSVTKLQQGDHVLLHLQEGARHTGISIQETILEK